MNKPPSPVLGHLAPALVLHVGFFLALAVTPPPLEGFESNVWANESSKDFSAISADVYQAYSQAKDFGQGEIQDAPRKIVSVLGTIRSGKHSFRFWPTLNDQGIHHQDVWQATYSQDPDPKATQLLVAAVLEIEISTAGKKLLSIAISDSTSPPNPEYPKPAFTEDYAELVLEELVRQGIEVEDELDVRIIGLKHPGDEIRLKAGKKPNMSKETHICAGRLMHDGPGN